MRAKQRVAQLEEATVTLREQNSELRQRVDSLSYMQQDLQATVARLAGCGGWPSWVSM